MGRGDRDVSSAPIHGRPAPIDDGRASRRAAALRRADPNRRDPAGPGHTLRER